MLGYWDPFTEMNRIHDRFFGRPTQEREYVFRPPVDIYEDKDGIHVTAELAGVKPEDIKVEVENKILTLSGQRKLVNEDKRDGYHRIERVYGSFSRSFSLSDEVSADEIEAQYDNGVLHLRLPKRPTAKRREIHVKAA